jgi:ABC-type tungstate transport system permease subunit
VRENRNILRKIRNKTRHACRQAARRANHLGRFCCRGELEISVEGDKQLFNQYGVMLVNPEKFPTVKKELGQAFVDWLISAEGQAAIAGYRIDGQQFFPNAEKKGT